MKKGFAPIILIAVLALVIAVGGVGIGLAWKTNRLDKWLPPNIKEIFGRGEKPEEVVEGEPEEEPEEEPETKPEEDLTEDWKTYTSPDYGYSIKYPSDLYFFGPYCPAGTVPEEECERTVIRISNHEEEAGTINLTVFVVLDTGETLDQILSADPGDVSNVEKFEINGIAARRFLVSRPGDSSDYPAAKNQIFTITIRSGWVFYLIGVSSSSATDDPYNSDNYKTMWKMMSTFEFTE